MPNVSRFKKFHSEKIETSSISQRLFDIKLDSLVEEITQDNHEQSNRDENEEYP